eukprot:scaffold1846_cov65-Phaeocystis_antarctica.AAC.6
MAKSGIGIGIGIGPRGIVVLRVLPGQGVEDERPDPYERAGAIRVGPEEARVGLARAQRLGRLQKGAQLGAKGLGGCLRADALQVVAWAVVDVIDAAVLVPTRDLHVERQSGRAPPAWRGEANGASAGVGGCVAQGPALPFPHCVDQGRLGDARSHRRGEGGELPGLEHVDQRRVREQPVGPCCNDDPCAGESREGGVTLVHGVEARGRNERIGTRSALGPLKRGAATAPATSVWALTQPSRRPETVSHPSSSLGTALPGAASKAGEQSSWLRSTHTPLDRVKPPHGVSAAQSAWHDAADGSLDSAVRAAAAGNTSSHSPRRRKQLPLLGASIAVEPPEEEKQRRRVSVVPPPPPPPPVAVYAPSASGKGRKGTPQLAAPEVVLAAAIRTGMLAIGSVRMRRHVPLLRGLGGCGLGDGGDSGGGRPRAGSIAPTHATAARVGGSVSWTAVARERRRPATLLRLLVPGEDFAAGSARAQHGTRKRVGDRRVAVGHLRGQSWDRVHLVVGVAHTATVDHTAAASKHAPAHAIPTSSAKAEAPAGCKRGWVGPEGAGANRGTWPQARPPPTGCWRSVAILVMQLRRRPSHHRSCPAHLVRIQAVAARPVAAACVAAPADT